MTGHTFFNYFIQIGESAANNEQDIPCIDTLALYFPRFLELQGIFHLRGQVVRRLKIHFGFFHQLQ